MANNHGIDLKVFLEPELKNLKQVQENLGNTVKAIGDSKLTKQYDVIAQKVSGLDRIFEETFDITTFKNVSKELQTIFNDIQKFTSSVGDLDSLQGFNEIEQQILKINKEIAITEERMRKIKTGGRIDKNSQNFSFFAKDLDTQVVKKDVKRIDGIKGAGSPGSQIKTYASLLKYKEKMEEQQQTENKTYKNICSIIDNIKKEEAKRTLEYQEQLTLLEKQKSSLNKMQEQAKQIASQPITNHKEDQKTIANQEKFNQIYADAFIGKSKVLDKTKEAIEKEKEVQEGQEKTGKDIEEVTKIQEKQNGIIGKAVKNFTSYTLVLGTMKRALNSAIQTIQVLDKSLTEQAMVAGKNKKELYSLLSVYQDIGKATGATTKEVAEVSTQYFRQGKSAKEAVILTEAAVSAAKVGAISTADSVDYLTTAINGFGMAAEDATRVSDRFSALAANSATNYEELAIALSKVAAQAHLAEMSMDFTLGLLAKGIETTREAPETIGTALKTVIARIREMTDYGKTLEDGVSVNNLETQLKYVGIALRDNNGELRSSEAVLNEVGKGWDSFSKNQQAALAKAFAGTRQQSRFIALMQDYDRTLELVNISQESSGATMAQMSVYMQGMEAALNQINVGWETLITTFVQSDVIIGILDKFGEVLNNLGQFFNDQKYGAERIRIAIGSISTALALMFANMLGAKIQEKREQKELVRIQQQQNLENLKAQKQALKQNVLLEYEARLEEAITNYKKAQDAYDKKQTAEGDAALKLAKQKVVEAQNQYNVKLAEVNASKEMADIDKQISEEKFKQGKVTQHITGLLGLWNLFTTIGNSLEVARLMIFKKQTKEKATQLAMEKAAHPLRALAGAALTAAAVGLGAAVVAIGKAIKNADPEYQNEQRRKAIKETNTEIYQLTQRKVKIENATSAYERYQDVVLKTKKDQEDINKTLDTASEVLDDEQRKEYALKKTIEEKYAYLQKIQQLHEKELSDKRLEQENRFNEFDDLTSEINNHNEVRSGVQDIVSHRLKFKVSDENQGKIKNLFDTYIGNMLGKDLATLYQDKDLSNFYDAARRLDQGITGSTSLDILNNGTLIEQIHAYKTAITGANAEVKAIIDSEFEGIGLLAKNFNDKSIGVLNQKGFNYETISNTFSKFQNQLEDFTLADFNQLLTATDKLQFLQQGGWLTNTNSSVVGGLLQDLLYGPKGSEEQVAQDITKFEDKIQNLYETQSKWNTMTADEQQRFMKDHPDFFSNQEAYNKFITGQDLSQDIEKYLKQNEKEVLASIDAEIEAHKVKIKTLKNGEEKEAERIKLLEAEKRREFIKSGEIYKQSLEIRLKKEQDAVKVFKKILQQQQEAVIDNLNKQKKAYEDYFAAINQQVQDDDYFEKRDRIIENITKIGAGTDAHSLASEQDLINQWQELEKERLQTLKERGQEAVMQNIDQEIDKANLELEDIKNNSQKIIDLMSDKTEVTKTLKQGAFNIISDKNMSATEKESALNELLRQASPYLLEQGIKLDPNAFSLSSDNKTLNFSVNGTTQNIDLSEDDQQDLWKVVLRILTQLGLQ